MVENVNELTLSDRITANPAVMGGRRVFRGTRVPVEVLFENLADGMSVDEILNDCETVNRDDIVAVLELTSMAMAGPQAA